MIGTSSFVLLRISRIVCTPSMPGMIQSMITAKNCSPAASASTSLSTASRPDSTYSGFMPRSWSMICVDSHTTSSSSTMSTGKSMNSSYTLSSSSAIFRNTVAVNVEPLPSSLFTSISPFIMRAAESAIGSPSPVPCCSATSLRSARENASNTCGR